MKALYIAVRDLILTLSWVGEVKLWNNQLDAMEAQEEMQINFPAVYVSFQEAFYSNSSGKRQLGEVRLVIKIVNEFYNVDDNDESMNLIFFDRKQEVFALLQQYQVAGVFEPLNRIEEINDEDHSSYLVFDQIYSTRFVDCDADVEGEYDQETTADLDAVIEGNLDIDNNIIRTGNGTFD